jgi:hypothetical protein
MLGLGRLLNWWLPAVPGLRWMSFVRDRRAATTHPGGATAIGLDRDILRATKKRISKTR